MSMPALYQPANPRPRGAFGCYPARREPTSPAPGRRPRPPRPVRAVPPLRHGADLRPEAPRRRRVPRRLAGRHAARVRGHAGLDLVRRHPRRRRVLVPLRRVELARLRRALLPVGRGVRALPRPPGARHRGVHAAGPALQRLRQAASARSAPCSCSPTRRPPATCSCSARCCRSRSAGRCGSAPCSARLLSIMYLFRGGLRSVVITERIQFVLMFGGFAVIIPYLVARYGGLSFLKANLPASHWTWHGGSAPAGRLRVVRAGHDRRWSSRRSTSAATPRSRRPSRAAASSSRSGSGRCSTS